MISEKIKIFLDRQIEEAEKSYLAQTGAAAACQLEKEGRVTGGLKYDEGRLVAFQAARRHMKQKLAVDDFTESLEKEYASWQAELDLHQGKADPSISWVAYSQGGVDALRLLIDYIRSISEARQAS
jgi:hypothetical protein